MDNFEDRRVKRTRKILKEVLIDALQTKPLSKISVKYICEEADINRSTFYLHYSNVFGLWDAIEDEIITNMNRILYKFEAGNILKKPLPMLIEVTRYLESESILNKKLFQCRESVVLLDKIKNCFINYFVDNCKSLFEDKAPPSLEMYSIFVISGSVSLFYKWFLGEIKISLNELAHTIDKLITGGVEDYLFN